MTHDIDDQVVSWLTRGTKLSEEMAREAVAEIRWTERGAISQVPSMKGPPTYNVILRDGPGDGLLMEMPAGTGTLVWDSPLRSYEPGHYLRTDDVEEGLGVFRWEKATS